MLKIKYITHACLYITINKIKILVDPWLNGPSWGGNIWHFPKNLIQIKNLKKPDIIFFSHGHDDHFHKPTINQMPKSWKQRCKVITADFGPNNKWWIDEIKKVGFKNIQFLVNQQNLKMNNNSSLTLIINDRGETDSSLIINYKKKKILLQTDNIMSKNEAKKIRKKNKIDVLFAMPFMTGAFPAFYRLKPIDSEKMIKGSQLKKIRALKYSTDITKIINPKFVIPYASDIGYMGENFYANFISSQNKNDFKEFIKKRKIKSKVKIMTPGDYLQLKNNYWKFKITNYEYSNEIIKKFYYENIDRFDLEQEQEKKYIKPVINKLAKIFTKKLNNHFYKNNPKIKFDVVFKIKENQNKIIEFKLKKNNISSKYLKKINNNNDLIIELDSYRLRRMLHGDYPMQFLTFHNGGYHCTRNTIELTEREKKFWEWINFFTL